MPDTPHEDLPKLEPKLTGQVLEDRVHILNRDLDVALHVVPEYLDAKKAQGRIPENQAVLFKRGDWNYNLVNYRDNSGRILIRSIIRDKPKDGNTTTEIYELRMPALQVVGSTSREPGKDMEIIVNIDGVEPPESSQTAADEFAAMIKDVLNPPDSALNFKPEEMQVPQPPEFTTTPKPVETPALVQPPTGVRGILARARGMLPGNSAK